MTVLESQQAEEAEAAEAQPVGKERAEPGNYLLSRRPEGQRCQQENRPTENLIKVSCRLRSDLHEKLPWTHTLGQSKPTQLTIKKKKKKFGLLPLKIIRVSCVSMCHVSSFQKEVA